MRHEARLEEVIEGWNEKIEKNPSRKREIEEATMRMKEQEMALMRERWEGRKKEKETACKERDAQLKIVHVLINKVN